MPIRRGDPDWFMCGHPRIPENTKLDKKGSRCRQCDLARKRAAYDANLAAAGKVKKIVDPVRFPCGHPRTPENRKAGKRDCKECHRVREAERHAAKLTAAGKRKRTYDPEWFPCGHPKSSENMTTSRHCRECHAARNRRRAQWQRIAIAVQKQDWRLANLERAREYDRRRSILRPDTRLARLSRRAREQDLRNPETQEYVAIIMADPCVYCGGPVATRDHIVPISTGGPNRWDNYAPACNGCNAAKGNKPLLGFLLDRRLMLDYREGRTA